MGNDSVTTNNVVFHEFGQKQRPGDALEAVAAASKSKCRKSIIVAVKGTFKSLVRTAAQPAYIETSSGVGYYDKKRPSRGAYNTFIGYHKDGTPNFFIRYEIDNLKEKRQYTSNAIEMRCDALALAIYIGGICQIDPETLQVSEGIRLVIYNHLELKPTAIETVKSAEELVDKLHYVLVTNYNKLAREYNLAGYTTEFLTLKSSHPALPSISIDMRV